MNLIQLFKEAFTKGKVPDEVHALFESQKRVKRLSEESVKQNDILIGMIREIRGTKPKKRRARK